MGKYSYVNISLLHIPYIYYLFIMDKKCKVVITQFLSSRYGESTDSCIFILCCLRTVSCIYTCCCLRIAVCIPVAVYG